MDPERILPVNGVELCVQAIGRPTDPPVLLIGGMSSPMDWWEDGFCERLAEGGRYVVRYDLRDTGRSTTYPPGQPGYTGSDLRDDVIALLDALGIDSAHLVGISMGAAIAQCLAVEHPTRVRTLTLMSTTGAIPGLPDGLPGPAPELAAFFEAAAERPAPDWADRGAVIDMLVDDQRAFMRGGFEEPRVRAITERIVDRSTDIAAMVNHGMLKDGRDVAGAVTDIAVPTLVVHGTADPLFPLPHGEALARAIPGADLLTLAGVGHEAPPPAAWDRVVTALLEHTDR